jgi:hypothetical protein
VSCASSSAALTRASVGVLTWDDLCSTARPCRCAFGPGVATPRRCFRMWSGAQDCHPMKDCHPGVADRDTWPCMWCSLGSSDACLVRMRSSFRGDPLTLPDGAALRGRTVAVAPTAWGPTLRPPIGPCSAWLNRCPTSGGPRRNRRLASLARPRRQRPPAPSARASGHPARPGARHLAASDVRYMI